MPPLRPPQAGTLRQTAPVPGLLGAGCAMPPATCPCLGPDAPRLGMTRRGLEEPSRPAHQGQFHLGSCQELGQRCHSALCPGRKASIPGLQGQCAEEEPSPAGAPRQGNPLAHSACAVLGSQLHALLQTPWDPAPGTLCAAMLSSEGLTAPMGLEEKGGSALQEIPGWG